MPLANRPCRWVLPKVCVRLSSALAERLRLRFWERSYSVTPLCREAEPEPPCPAGRQGVQAHASPSWSGVAASAEKPA